MTQRRKVILADAGGEYGALLADWLERTGEFTVQRLRDRGALSRCLREETPDCLLLAGFPREELALLCAAEQLPVTFVLSVTAPPELVEAVTCRNAYFWRKPISQEALLRRLRALSCAGAARG